MDFLKRLSAALCVLVPPIVWAVPPPATAGAVFISVHGTACWEGRPNPDANCFATVTVSSPQSMDLTVELSTADGTATAPADYSAINRLVVTIPEGARSVNVPLNIVNDRVSEGDEFFTVSIANPSHGQIGNDRDTVTILDGHP